MRRQLGLREGDALRVTRSAIRDGVFTIVTSKSGTTVRVPILSHLAAILAECMSHDAITIAATRRGKPWTESGFRASWRTLRIEIEKAGKIEPGLGSGSNGTKTAIQAGECDSCSQQTGVVDP